MQQIYNLVYNHDFRYFSNATDSSEVPECNVPDGWIYSNTGASSSISYDKEKGELVIETSSESDQKMSLSQNLNEFPRWKQTVLGKSIQARIYAWASYNCLLFAKISDGINSHIVAWEKSNENIVILDLELDTAPSAETLFVEIYTSTPSAQIRLQSFFVNEGNSIVEKAPCIVSGIIGSTHQYISTENAPAGELSLCEDSRELTEQETRLNSVLNGRFGLGPNGRSILPDVRGYFMRLWDNQADIDPDANDRTPLGSNDNTKGDTVGTVQLDEFKKHRHSFGFSESIPQLQAGGEGTPINTQSDTNTSEVGGKETRGVNISYLQTMKWA